MVGVSLEHARAPRLLLLFAVLFCLAAPWSIAIAQISVVAMLLAVLADAGRRILLRRHAKNSSAGVSPPLTCSSP